jgi:hypothetical protein
MKSNSYEQNPNSGTTSSQSSPQAVSTIETPRIRDGSGRGRRCRLLRRSRLESVAGWVRAPANGGLPKVSFVAATASSAGAASSGDPLRFVFAGSGCIIATAIAC